MSRSFAISLLFPLSIMSACSSMPKDAPTEFVDAKSSLDTMDHEKVKEKLPNTTHRAHSTFKDAVSDLKQARKDGASEVGAIQKARDTKEIADNSIEMNNRVTIWDQDQSKLNAALRDLKTPRSTVVINQNQPAAVSPFAKLKDKDIVNTVAYFRTGDSNSPIMNKKQLDSIASVLKADKSFHVVLTGHADKRGAGNYNDSLAMKRAKTIATALQQQGISRDQIVYRSVGKAEALGATRSQARMQLDRNVEAVVNLR